LKTLHNPRLGARVGVTPSGWPAYSIARRCGRELHPAAENRVVHNQHDHGTDNGHESAVHSEARYPAMAKLGENPTAHDCANDAEDNVQEYPFPAVVHELAGNESGDQP
jgi:hypothetical protein